MSLFPKLINAKPLPGYHLHLDYDDGISGDVNLSHWVSKGVFQAWQHESAFRSFFITPTHKLEWSDEIDMDPDAFYLELIGKSFKEYARDKQVLRHSH